jgi:FG-GAP-like repeat
MKVSGEGAFGGSRGIRRLPTLLGILLTSAAMLGAFAPSASALPDPFFGLQASSNYAEDEANMEAVARSGAKYWRLGFNCFDWYQNQFKIWEKWDKEMTLAWQHGLTVLATVGSRCNLDSEGKASARIPQEGEWNYTGSVWNIFLENLVKRYGYGGSFWSGKENKKEIGVWEVMNEPNRGVWGLDGVTADGKYYGKFLKKSAEYIHNAQGTFFPTTVLFGGMLRLNTGGGNKSPEDFMSEAASVGGFASLVNGVAIHPYSWNYNQLTDMSEYIFKTFRPALDKSFGSGMDMWITEIGWGVTPEAVVGGVNQYTPPVSPEWQSSLVWGLLQWAKDNEAKLHLKSLIFYMYRDAAGAGGGQSGGWDSYAGLRKEAPKAAPFSQATFRPAWYSFQSQTGAAKWPVAPAAQTLAPTNVSTTEATLNGTVNPHGLPTGYHFELAVNGGGFSQWIPAQDTEAGWKEGNISESATLTNLQPNTTYAFRIVGTNENHEITVGGEQSFKTLATSPAVILDSGGVEHVYTRSSAGQLEEWYQVGSRWARRRWGPTNNVAGSPNAIVDKTGKIWVYFRSTKGQLRYWWFQGTNWAEEERGYENAMAGDPAVIEDKEGRRWVYFRGTNGTLRNWWFQGTNWAEEEHGYANTVGGDPAVIEDKEGRRWVYFRGTNGTLRNWWFQGTNWAEEEHGYANTVGGDPAVIEDKEGRRWVYFRGTNGTLRNWWFQGTNWAEEEHGYANTVGGDPTAFEDTEGRRWVYFRGPSGKLKSWWFKGTNWAEEEIGAAASISDPTGIARPLGKREIFYFSGEGAPFRWRFGSSEAALDSISTLLPFAGATSWGGWSSAYSMYLADLDGDGKADLVGRDSAGTVKVSLSTGNGFKEAVSWGGWSNPALSMYLADLDGDGKADLVGRDSGGTVKVSLSTGNGFKEATSWGGWSTAYSMELADLDGDKKADLVGRDSGGTVKVSLSAGNGFKEATSWGGWSTAYSMYLADLDGDGKADLVGRDSAGTVKVSLSTGNGFKEAVAWGGWSNPALSMYLADLDGDKKADLVGRDSAGTVKVSLSTGNGFKEATSWGGWSTGYSMYLADLDGDKKADLVGRDSAGTVKVSLSTGNGFKEATSWGGWSNPALSMYLADLNGDGKSDISGRESSGEVFVGPSNGSLLTSGALWATWASACSLDFADVNGDGRADIIGRNTATGTVQVGLSTP